MAFNYFQDSNKSRFIARWALQSTSFLSRRLPEATAKFGARFLLSTHASHQVSFDVIKPDSQLDLRSQAGSFRAHVFGQGSTVAIISHGWGDNSASFQHLIQSLLEQGYCVVSVDHVGHGQSDSRRSHLLAFMEALDMVIKQVESDGKSVEVMIGHSMGGMAILNLPEPVLKNRKILMIAVPVNLFSLMFDTVERFGISREVLMRVLERISARYGKRWTDLKAQSNLSKCHEQITFIHDVNDRYAPFSDTEAFTKEAKVRLIPTEGLGHRRIVSDTGVLSIIKEVLAPV